MEMEVDELEAANKIESILHASLNDVAVEKEEREESPPKKNLWDQIVEQCEKDRREVEDYIRSKNVDNEVFPEPLATMNKVLFPLLLDGMEEMLHRIKDDERAFYRQKSTLDGIDFLSEYLYNMNPNYPERQSNWRYIFDMDWVVDFLEENPRPHYPFHLVWSRNFAALKIQSYMRGYWARIHPDVLEIRNFWKALKEDREEKECLQEEECSQSDSKQHILPPLNL